MFRNVIAPVQAWLLSQGQCVGCGMPLVKGTLRKKRDGTEVVTCRCGRTYIKVGERRYRRARMSETAD
jgi:predicted  nucleic acid-binding Zn-ribbon protein